MRWLLFPVFILAIAGCGVSERVRLNPGADLAWYEASPQWIWDNLPHRAGQRIWGFYDPEDGSITMDRTLSPYGKMRVGPHELGHAHDHQKPQDMWELLGRYHSPAFPLLSHSQEEIELGREIMEQFTNPADVVRAMEAAREAAAAEAKP